MDEIVNSKMSQFDFILKIVICGNSGVGKTKILNRYLKKSFDMETKATIGVDFFGDDIKIGNNFIKVQFFDTAGQEKYHSICSTYYKNCDGVLLLYDITDRESFEKLNYWLREILSNAEKKVKVLVIGNKNDLEEERKISENEGMDFATKNGLFFTETSALTNRDNCVEKAFENIIFQITNDLQKENDDLELEKIRQKTVKFNLDEGKLNKLANNNQNKSRCC
jgi:small GTP-binding protein